jgi:hypothetical protein
VNINLIEIVMNSSASKEKLLFDQHKGSDGLRIESCTAQRDCVTAS